MTMLTLLKLISAAHRVTLFGRLGILLLVLWHIDDPEPGPTLMLICNDFSVAVALLDLAPKSRYLTPCFGGCSAISCSAMTPPLLTSGPYISKSLRTPS